MPFCLPLGLEEVTELVSVLLFSENGHLLSLKMKLMTHTLWVWCYK